MQLYIEKLKDYELLDSGEGEKLERYGEYVLRRPDPQAIWQKNLTLEWDKADATYVRSGASGKWNKNNLPESWKINLDGIVFNLSLLPSKHLGVFPEQYSGWQWLEEKAKREKRKISALNLFSYTGGATMALAKNDVEVCHLDASKFAVDMAKKNCKDSNLENKKVRFIVDDVRKFVEREIKRGSKYDIITMDPPVYGKGNKGEVWKIEKDLAELLSRVRNILSKDPVAVVLNGYASSYSGQSYENLLSNITKDLRGKLEHGDLGIKESIRGNILTAGIFTRWSK